MALEAYPNSLATDIGLSAYQNSYAMDMALEAYPNSLAAYKGLMTYQNSWAIYIGIKAYNEQLWYDMALETYPNSLATDMHLHPCTLMPSHYARLWVHEKVLVSIAESCFANECYNINLVSLCKKQV